MVWHRRIVMELEVPQVYVAGNVVEDAAMDVVTGTIVEHWMTKQADVSGKVWGKTEGVSKRQELRTTPSTR